MLIPPVLVFLARHANRIAEEGDSVLDFGDQRLFNQSHALYFLDKKDHKKFEMLNDFEQVTEIYKSLGFPIRETIDCMEVQI